MTRICCPKCNCIEIKDLGFNNQLLCEYCNYSWINKMAKSLKYQWCSEDSDCSKEFFGWVFDRLQFKGDSPIDSHMIRLDKKIDAMPGIIPNGPPITIDITDNKPVTILRHGKIIYTENK